MPRYWQHCPRDDLRPYGWYPVSEIEAGRGFAKNQIEVGTVQPSVASYSEISAVQPQVGNHTEAGTIRPQSNIGFGPLQAIADFNNQTSQEINTELQISPSRWDTQYIDPQLLQANPNTAVTFSHSSDQNRSDFHGESGAAGSDMNPALARHESGAQDFIGSDPATAYFDDIDPDAAPAAAEQSSFAEQRKLLQDSKGKSKQSAPIINPPAAVTNPIAPAPASATAAALTHSSVPAQAGGTSSIAVPVSRVRKAAYGKHHEYFDPEVGKWVPAIYHAEIRANLLWDADQTAAQYGGYGNFPPTKGYDATDRTSFVPAHKTWGPERANRPQINFLFDKPNPSILAGIQVNSQPRKWIYHGYVVLDHTNQPMRDFDDCPTVLSSCPEGFRLDAIEKRNPNIKTSDLWGRLPDQHHEQAKDGKLMVKNRMTKTGLTNRSMRFRRKAGILSWSKRAGHDDVKRFLEEFLTPQQLQNKTTRGGRDEDLSAIELKELDDYLEALGHARLNALPIPAPPGRSFGLAGATSNALQGTTTGHSELLSYQPPGPATFGINGYAPSSNAGPSAPAVSQLMPPAAAYQPLDPLNTAAGHFSPLGTHPLPTEDDASPAFSPRSIARSAMKSSGVLEVSGSPMLPNVFAPQEIAASGFQPDQVPDFEVPDTTLRLVNDSYPQEPAPSQGLKRKNVSTIDDSFESDSGEAFDLWEGDNGQNTYITEPAAAVSQSDKFPNQTSHTSKKRRLGPPTDNPPPDFSTGPGQQLKRAAGEEISSDQHLAKRLCQRSSEGGALGLLSQEIIRKPKPEPKGKARSRSSRSEKARVISKAGVEVPPGVEPIAIPINKWVTCCFPDERAVHKAMPTGAGAAGPRWEQLHPKELISQLKLFAHKYDEPTEAELQDEPVIPQVSHGPSKSYIYQAPEGTEAILVPVGKKIVLICGTKIMGGVIAANQQTAWEEMSVQNTVRLLSSMVMERRNNAQGTQAQHRPAEHTTHAAQGVYYAQNTSEILLDHRVTTQGSIDGLSDTAEQIGSQETAQMMPPKGTQPDRILYPEEIMDVWAKSSPP